MLRPSLAPGSCRAQRAPGLTRDGHGLVVILAAGFIWACAMSHGPRGRVNTHITSQMGSQKNPRYGFLDPKVIIFSPFLRDRRDRSLQFRTVDPQAYIVGQISDRSRASFSNG